MRLSKSACKIIGLRVGEMELNSLNPGSPMISVKFMLLQSNGDSSGHYEKKLGWSEETVEALTKFVEAAEKDGLSDLFEYPDDDTHLSAEVPEENDELSWPTLGGDDEPPQV